MSVAVAGAGTLLDAWMPEWDEAEHHSTVVHAPAERVYAVARKLDIGRSPVIRGLTALRSLPGLLFPRRARRGERDGGGSRTGFDRLIAAGFVVLDERPGEELVMGLVGRFWTADGGRVRVTPEEFCAFEQPGYARAAWNFSLAPQPGGGVCLATETRVLCTDDEARRSFRRYWRFIRPFSGLIRREMLRTLRIAAERADGG